MKKIIALSMVLLGLLLASYYGMGVLTERNLKHSLGTMHDSNKYKVKVANYRRGFFKSKAIINVEIISLAKVIEHNGRKIFKPSHTYFTAVPLVIYHGPIIFAGSMPRFGLGYSDSHITVPGQYIKNFDNKYTKNSTRPELDVNIFVSYAANTSINISAPKFRLISNNKNSNFEWQGMSSHIDVSRDLNDINGKVDVKGLSWMQDKVLTVLKEVNSYFKLYKGDFDLYLGDSGVHVPSVVVSNDSATLIELVDLDFKSNSFINKKLFNSSLQATLDKFYINQKTYENCSLALYVRNLDAKKLIEVNNKIKRVQNGTERQRKQAVLSILPDLPELLNKGAEIEISDFSVDMQEGNIRSSFILSLPHDKNRNPFYLIQKARGSGHIQITKSLLSMLLQDLYAKYDSKAETIDNSSKALNADNQTKDVKETDLASIRAQNKISELLKQGFLLDTDANYVADIRIVQGRIMINDKPFSMGILRL